MYKKLTLLALIALFSTQAIAADSSNHDNAAKETASSVPTVPATTTAAPEVGNKDVVSATAPDNTARKAKGLPYYAKVGNMVVTWVDYNYAYANEARKKFYHAKPSEAATALFQRQIGDTLVTNAMLVQEAKRRKLKPDAAFVKQQLEQLEQRFANDPNWPDSRPRVLPILTARIQSEYLRNELEKRVRDVPPPSVKQLRKYYAAHPEKFTSPQQIRVATILLRVDPGAPDADWQKANEEAQDLIKRLRAGEDFAELARNYSGDTTAEEGGDMGYLHEGMLPGLPAETVNKLQPGETADPVTLMEGVAIFRLTERKPPELNSFEAVKPRATELLRAEQSENAWNSLIAKLKKNTPVQVDESPFLPLPVVAEKPLAVKPIDEKTVAEKPLAVKPIDEKTVGEKPAENMETSKPASN